MKVLEYWATGVGLLLALWGMASQNYLLFHAVVEFSGIAVVAAMFAPASGSSDGLRLVTEWRPHVVVADIGGCRARTATTSSGRDEPVMPKAGCRMRTRRRGAGPSPLRSPFGPPCFRPAASAAYNWEICPS